MKHFKTLIVGLVLDSVVAGVFSLLLDINFVVMFLICCEIGRRIAAMLIAQERDKQSDVFQALLERAMEEENKDQDKTE